MKIIKSLIAALKGPVMAFVLTESQKAVAALKQTPIGAAVASNIAAIESEALSGQQKFEAVVANTLPLIVSYVAQGGVKAVVDDVEDIGRALVQQVYNDTRSTKAGQIAQAILALFGKK